MEVDATFSLNLVDQEPLGGELGALDGHDGQGKEKDVAQGNEVLVIEEVEEEGEGRSSIPHSLLTTILD